MALVIFFLLFIFLAFCPRLRECSVAANRAATELQQSCNRAATGGGWEETVSLWHCTLCLAFCTRLLPRTRVQKARQIVADKKYKAKKMFCNCFCLFFLAWIGWQMCASFFQLVISWSCNSVLRGLVRGMVCFSSVITYPCALAVRARAHG